MRNMTQKQQQEDEKSRHTKRAGHADDSTQWHLEATHLVVFQHGLLGNNQDFHNFELLFRQYFPLDEVLVHSPSCNATSFLSPFQTYDGIDRGGERLADEIQKLAATMPRLTKFSIAGHSLGGLYARYCIGVLFARGFFEKIEPMNFITLATPHMGIRRPHRGGVNMLFNSVVPKLFDRTGQQFTLNDTASEQTLALSRPSRKYMSRTSHTAGQEMDGAVLARFSEPRGEAPATSPPAMATTARLSFEVYDCALSSDRYLRFFEQKSDPKEEGSALLMELDLLASEVTLLVPDATALGSEMVVGKEGNADEHSRSAGDSQEEGVFWDLKIRSNDRVVVIRMAHDELVTQWRWVVAIINSSGGALCRTVQPGESSTTVLTSPSLSPSPAPAPSSSPSPSPSWSFQLAGSSITSSFSPTPSSPPSPSTSTLSCMARGQFIQALQLFRARTLYASVFFDLQVPYSGASIRAFNPYRIVAARAAHCTTSPFYRHITMRSLWNAPLVRDTLPPSANELPSKLKTSARNLLVKALVARPRRHSVRQHALLTSYPFTNVFGVPSMEQGKSFSGPARGRTTSTSLTGSPLSSSQLTRPKPDSRFPLERHSCIEPTTTSSMRAPSSASSSSSSRPGSAMLASATGSTSSSLLSSLSSVLSSKSIRLPPLVDGMVLLDLVHDTFSSDGQQRDALRGILLSLQCIGWRRIDVLFESVLAHEHIIAKRANPNKSLDGGLDIVHHVMDTFLL